MKENSEQVTVKTRGRLREGKPRQKTAPSLEYKKKDNEKRGQVTTNRTLMISH